MQTMFYPPKRQTEINDLLEKLARFNPTKIAIEGQYKSTRWPDLYQKYLAGDYNFGRNEIEQIGFQLARRLNLKTVYPVDFPMYMSGLTDSEIEEPKPKPAASEAKVPEPASVAQPLSGEDKLLHRLTVTEYFRHLNDDQRIQNGNASYMQMLLPNDDPAIYARVDLVANWYKRNLRIFANLSRITDFGNDRIFLIIGSGHLKILRGFAVDSPDFCLVDTQFYLK